MANTFTLKSSSYDGRYMQVDLKQTSNGSSKNSSTVEWTLSTIGGQYWYDTGPTTLVINGTTVCSIEFKSWEYGKFPVAIGSTSGTITIPHNNDGTKKVTVKLSTAIYYHTVQDYSGTWTLTEIPRYPSVSHSLKSRTEDSITMNWSSDSAIEIGWFSTDDGETWANFDTNDQKSGTYTIWGLDANTDYQVVTSLRRKDSGLEADSDMLEVTTYDYPHCTKAPDFVIGNAVTLEFYNPLNRAFSFTIVGNGQNIHTWTNRTEKSYPCANDESTVSNLYASIPNDKNAKYSVKVTYDGETKTKSGGTYFVNESINKPTFTDFTYKDADALSSSVSGNDQVLIQGKSNLKVFISKAQNMIAKNGANPAYYSVTIDTLAKTTVAYSQDITTELGAVLSFGSKRLTVRAYDSRGIFSEVYKDVYVYEYSKPTINFTATRKNNFEAETTLSVKGKYSQILIGGVAKNTINDARFTYREVGSTTWANWEPFSADKKGNGEYAYKDLIKSFDNTKAYELKVNVADVLTTTNTATVFVDVGEAIFFISSNKKKCYINGEEVVPLSQIHPVGSVLCTSTNTNPSATYVGTWTLIDKGFKSHSSFTEPPDVFTAGTNVVADTIYLSRGGNTIRIRLSLIINSAISDTGMSLGTLKWADVGITGLHAGIIEQLAYRDGANGGIVYTIYHESGEIQLVDVFDQSSITTGNTFYLDFTFVSDHTRMLDSVCDKFYWKRTA